jgi:hypothetical protein
LHNVCFLQQNIFCSESKVLGLCGDSNQADVYRIDPTSAARTQSFQVPAWHDLKGAQSSSDVNALVVPDQNPSTAKFNHSIWIPPLVLTTILEAKSLVPSDSSFVGEISRI